MKIFLDVDGVLADFVGAACAAWGVEREDPTEWDGLYEICGVSAHEFWTRCNSHKFWANIPLLPWALDLVSNANLYAWDHQIFFATSPSMGPGCASGKVAWLQQHFKTRDYFITPRKWELAGPDRLLIDDYDENIRKWDGPSITFPQPYNRSAEHTGDRVDYVCRELARHLDANS